GIPGIKVKQVEEPAEKVRLLSTDLIRDCDMLLCTFPPENHEQMSQLNMVQISSAGYKQLIGQNLGERNIKACNALGVFDIPIAEWNIAMMINLARDVRGLIRNQENKVWDRAAKFQHEIRGSIVGIWGYGGIGRETARLAKALGLKVHVLSRNGISSRENIYCVAGTGDAEGKLPDRVFLMNEKAAFFKSIDFLVMAIPQTGNTEGIMGEAELKMLRPHVFLLNPARGPLIKEQALIRALKEGWIAGAALDTHYYYPMPAGHPLWIMPNVIFTPHISGSSSSPHFLERVYNIFIENVKRFQSGKPLLNELTPSQLKGE
ncbi:MAG TPA: D-2-hydroxyacid dehydrogenase, partial [Flavitalea sp.]|nr:D-2-hydroxyacid dehydrogenase [Flavitalea sp.]